MDNRPRSREKHVTENSKGVQRRGSGLSNPVGSSGKPGGSGSNLKRGGSIGLAGIVILLLLKYGPMLLGGSTGGSSLGGSPLGQLVDLGQTFSAGTTATESYPSSYSDATYGAGTLDTSVANGSRSKYTSIVGSNADQVTIMVYLCGTDLESRNGMATNDISEMTKATLNDQINLLVYTGGCSNWKNTVFSNTTNQIYKITKGGAQCVLSDDGNKSMTDPTTLTGFIKWCNENYPANRKELIFWDHGGGSLTGYGHDERSGHSGSMTLPAIDSALKKADTKFDFIGFDACLMATLETGLTLEPYADYLIASEETEPGIGWYYTNWLTNFAKDPSMPTIEVGKNIIDDFVVECNRSANRQKTTLSIVDLAELGATVPSKLNDFASSLNTKLSGNDYKEVSDARYQTREFGQSSSLDQIDLVDFAKKTGTYQGQELANALLSSVKYNRTSATISDAYGISIYFPYRKASRVNNAVSTYKSIGMDNEYTKCISSFAQIEVSGQSASGGTSSPASLLLGNGYADNGLSSLSTILNMLTNREISDEQVDSYVTTNKFDTANLSWKDVNGQKVIAMSEEQWSLVHDIELNMFYDDGTGYIDLGLDNVFSFDGEGNMVPETDNTWLAINDQPVAYYYEGTVENGDYYSITGRVPALLNGEKVDLILIFDTDHPQGYLAGARSSYVQSETETVAKALTELVKGDKIDFICNYYDYDGNFLDSYYLGEAMVLTGAPVISNVPVNGSTITAYRFTDIYNQTYWTEKLN